MLLFDTRKLLFLMIFKKGKRYPESTGARGVLFAYFGLGTLLYSRSIDNKKVNGKLVSICKIQTLLTSSQVYPAVEVPNRPSSLRFLFFWQNHYKTQLSYRFDQQNTKGQNIEYLNLETSLPSSPLMHSVMFKGIQMNR